MTSATILKLIGFAKEVGGSTGVVWEYPVVNRILILFAYSGIHWTVDCRDRGAKGTPGWRVASVAERDMGTHKGSCNASTYLGRNFLCTVLAEVPGSVPPVPGRYRATSRIAWYPGFSGTGNCAKSEFGETTLLSSAE
eukprot:3059323-Rhodomonas_salina.1